MLQLTSNGAWTQNLFDISESKLQTVDSGSYEGVAEKVESEELRISMAEYKDTHLNRLRVS